MGSSVLSRLVVELTLKSNGFQKGAAEAEKSVGRFRKALGGVATTAAGFLAANVISKGFSAIKNNIGSIISAGSDMNETISKTQAVFGDSADAMLKWGDTAAANLGMSKQAALEGASTIGNLLKGVGIANTELPNMSQALLQASADLGSFNNVDPSEVLDNLRSGLVGQAEPLRKYGILISEADVKTKAMEMGLVGVNGELTEGAKVQARYALIMAQLGDAAGDYAKTSGGLANGMRTLHANIADVRAEIGMKLVPTLAKGVKGVNNWFKKFNEVRARGVSPFMAAMVATRNAINNVFGKKAGDTFAKFVDRVADGIEKIMSHKKDIIGFAKAVLSAWWTLEKIGFQLMKLLVRAFQWGWSKISEPIHRFVNFIKGLDFHHGALGDLMDIFQAMAKGDWNSALKETKNFIGELWDKIVNLPWGTILSKIGGLLWDALVAAGTFLIQTGIPFLLSVGGQLLQALWSGLSAFWTSILWPFIQSLPGLIIHGIVDLITSDETQKLVTQAGNAIISGLGAGIQFGWDWLWGWFKDLPMRLVHVFDGLKELMKAVGNDIVSGIAEGFSWAWNWLMGWLTDIWNQLPNWARKLWDAHSPSRVFAEVGKTIPQGLAAGIQEETKKVTKAMTGLASQVTLNASPLAGPGAAGAMAPQAAQAVGGFTLAGGGGDTYNFTVNESQNAEATARAIIKTIRREKAARH